MKEDEKDVESTYMVERTVALQNLAYSPPYIVVISGNPGIEKLDLTGKLQLRYFVLTLPSKPGKTHALVHYCIYVVPGLLNATSLSCAGFRLMMKREHLSKIIMEIGLVSSGLTSAFFPKLTDVRKSPPIFVAPDGNFGFPPQLQS